MCESRVCIENEFLDVCTVLWVLNQSKVTDGCFWICIKVNKGS